jgi:hypothetical protein
MARIIIIIIWRLTGSRLASRASERRAQRVVAVSYDLFYLLADYVAVEAIRALAAGDRAGFTIVGLLTRGTAILELGLGVAKWRIGAPWDHRRPRRRNANLLCANLAIAVFIGLVANTLFGAW